MIVKEISRRAPAASKAAQVQALGQYVARLAEPDRANLVLTGGINFFSQTVEGHISEMAALAVEAPRSKDPFLHIVLSWPEDEQPTALQCKDAVQHLLTALGLRRHQALYAVHHDTDNLHLHALINRVDPATSRPTELNHWFKLEALHRAVAEIENANGWRSELNALYQIKNGKAVPQDMLQRQPVLTTGAQRFERQTGLASAQRIARERAKPIMARATSWLQLHSELAEVGMALRMIEGRGAIVQLGSKAVKASSVDRTLGLGGLERRLGPFEPAPRALAAKVAVVDDREFLMVLDPLVAEYHRLCEADRLTKREKRLVLKKQQAAAKAELRETQAAERKSLIAGNWHRSGYARTALLSVLSTEQADARAALAREHAAETAQLQASTEQFPDLRTWKAQRKAEAARLARQREDERLAQAALRARQQLKKPPADVARADVIHELARPAASHATQNNGAASENAPKRESQEWSGAELARIRRSKKEMGL